MSNKILDDFPKDTIVEVINPLNPCFGYTGKVKYVNKRNGEVTIDTGNDLYLTFLWIELEPRFGQN